jgi:hypothetical protein
MPFPRRPRLANNGKEELPVSWRRLIISPISPRWRPLSRTSITVGSVGVLISATGRRRAVGILVVVGPTCWWWVGFVKWRTRGPSRWWGAVAVTSVVLTGRGRTSTVFITKGAVASRRWATAVVALGWRVAVAATEGWWRARAIAVVAGNFVLGLER